jgi:hypothetical protein
MYNNKKYIYFLCRVLIFFFSLVAPKGGFPSQGLVGLTPQPALSACRGKRKWKQELSGSA